MTEYFYFYSPFWVNKFVELLISFDVSLIFILIYFNNIYLLLTKQPTTIYRKIYFFSHAYLDYWSSHPLGKQEQYPLLPDSIFLRLLVCSDEADFRTWAKLMVSKFINRHHPPPQIVGHKYPI